MEGEVKTILILIVLNIALPILDIVTDIKLVVKLYSSRPFLAIVMLTPFLLNYIVCFITFLRKEKNKKFTFIFALLNIYPQFGKNNHQEKSLE